jgi:hypothetical protein
MGEQRLHSALAPVDILTRAEHQDVMDTSLEHALRTKYKGVENQRFPRTYGTGAVTLNLFDPNAPIGPEQGDFWEVRRIIVKSSVLTDTAKYVIYRGTTPSDPVSGYEAMYLIEAGVGGATPGINVNVGFYPSSKALSLQPGEQIYCQVLGATLANTYILEGEAIRVPAEMKGKLLSS